MMLAGLVYQIANDPELEHHPERVLAKYSDSLDSAYGEALASIFKHPERVKKLLLPEGLALIPGGRDWIPFSLAYVAGA